MSPLRNALLAALLMAAQAHAQTDEEWLTIHGFPEDKAGDVVQINPTQIPWQNQFTMEVRVSRSTPRSSYRKHPYRSFKGVAVIDCSTQKGWYLSLNYYGEPAWQGPVTGREEYKENEAPVTFTGMPGEPARKLITASCKKR
ncbi:hypothetical protein SAMN05192589_110135 [Paracidovorax valerianellae]|uniref:Surface-adhesin protein E-like domain-containing protein n=1 Tax=Paracidovorax valerianellae TaxID=187868 RepID=A0A1G6YQW3_9BURK|nr:surface-adhesin E family protein [Paracidovorax valerianellae]SDD92701.1 hypothetical protein SAMN05192589_110135 [Paracidovorax valerianellae]